LHELRYGRDSIHPFVTFTDTLRNGTSEIQEVCGKESLSGVVAVGDAVSYSLCNVTTILRDVRLFFQCDNWYPHYERLTYDTVCYSGTEGFAWVASTAFVIVFMTMIILTLRITFYEVDNVEQDHGKDPNVKEAENSEEEEIGSSLELPSAEEEEPDETVEPYVLPKEVEHSAEFIHPHEPPSDTIYETPIQLSPEMQEDIFEGTWDNIIPEKD
jgi:hypothetical protein